MCLQYMILKSLHSHTFQHDCAIFTEYVPTLKPSIITYNIFKFGAFHYYLPV